MQLEEWLYQHVVKNIAIHHINYSSTSTHLQYNSSILQWITLYTLFSNQIDN